MVALESFGDLVADPFEVAVIEDHLAAIRDLDPGMTDLEAAALDCVPGSVIVKLTDDAREDFDAGIRTGFDDVRPAGRGEVTWRGTDVDGRTVASGVYVVRLQSEAGTDLQRVTPAK